MQNRRDAQSTLCQKKHSERRQRHVSTHRCLLSQRTQNYLEPRDDTSRCRTVRVREQHLQGANRHFPDGSKTMSLLLLRQMQGLWVTAYKTLSDEKMDVDA